MEFRHTLEIVTKDIQDIEKLVGNFKNYSGIPLIELDLALSRLRNVYDLLLEFRSDITSKSIPAVNIPVEKTGPEIRKEPTVKEHKKQEALKKPVIPEETEKVEKPVTVPEKNPKTQATVEKSSINEILAEQTLKKDLASKLKEQPIKNISSHIGINDKWLFIRELFAGNENSYSETLKELDGSRNFNEAYNFLMDKFQWDMDSDPVQTLLNLVRRKFISSGNE
jgi:hypothetical protein